MTNSDYIFVHIPKTAGRSILSALGVKFSCNHKTIYDYCNLLTEEVVRKKFKFTCVRNPWDRAVSWWEFFGNMGFKRIPFEEWLKTVGERNSAGPRQRFPIDQMSFCRAPSGEVLIDSFIRFERLEEDWSAIAKRIGVSSDLPFIGSNERQDQCRIREVMLRSSTPKLAPLVRSENYHDMYTSQESIDLVANMDAETIKRFGYKFQ